MDLLISKSFFFFFFFFFLIYYYYYYKFCIVFDGHCGSMASTFLKQRFPFELCATADFKAGNYKEALIKTYTNLHKELLSCSKYAPELFDCSFW